MPSIQDELRAFEAELDADLAALRIHSFNADSALALSSEIYEAAAMHPAAADRFNRGMTILAAALVSGKSGDDSIIEALVKDLDFASHYYTVREYLYYSYNVPGSMNWNITADRVDVRFSDPTIPRQFFTVFNDRILGSRDTFAEFADTRKEIRRLLKGESEGVQTPRVETAWALITQEVEIKLHAYFSILPESAPIELGGYTYAEFLAIYRALLSKALYNRYMAQENDVVGAIFIHPSELIGAVTQELGISAKKSELILSDIVFDQGTVRDRLDASYFSLFREAGLRGRIIMRPHHFATAEGLVNLLRVVAQRRPQKFLEQVSNELGRAFVQRLKASWDAQGFYCRTELSLRSYDPTLPDIDLLVISEEPTLGYVIFVCEVKSPLPPRWAKDQLKVLNRDSVSKAFHQASAVRDFLGTEAGIDFLEGILPQGSHQHFRGFIVTVQSLIITSDNGGMFFGNEDTPIISFRTLERLLRRSDGDVAYIQMVLRTYAEEVDAHLKTANMEFQVGDRTVSYEGVSDSPLLDFSQQTWKNSAERQAMIDQFIADGAHPFDVLPEPPSFPDGRPIHLKPRSSEE